MGAFRSKEVGKTKEDDGETDLPSSHHFGRLIFAILTDCLGNSSYIFDIFGGMGEGIVDLVTLPFIVRNYAALFPTADLIMVGGTFEEIMPYTDVIPTATIGVLLQYYCPHCFVCIVFFTKYIRMLAPFAWPIAFLWMCGVVYFTWRLADDFNEDIHKGWFYANTTGMLVCLAGAILILVIKYNAKRAAMSNHEAIQGKYEKLRKIAGVGQAVTGKNNESNNNNNHKENQDDNKAVPKKGDASSNASSSGADSDGCC